MGCNIFTKDDEAAITDCLAQVSASSIQAINDLTEVIILLGGDSLTYSFNVREAAAALREVVGRVILVRKTKFPAVVRIGAVRSGFQNIYYYRMQRK